MLVGLTAIPREAWSISQQTEDRREKRFKPCRWLECYSMKLDLLTNATVDDGAIRFVSEKGAAAVANAEPKINPHVEQKKQQQKITTKESKNQIIIILLPP